MQRGDRSVAKPTLFYFICCTRRSGGTLLSDELSKTRCLGAPRETFWTGHREELFRKWQAQNYLEFLNAAFADGTTPNGVYGARVFMQSRSFIEFLRELGREQLGYEDIGAVMKTFFPGARYVYLTRRNKLRQAVSLLRAYQTGKWTSMHSSSHAVEIFELERLQQFVRLLVTEEALWQDFFKEIQVMPLSLVYEDMDERLGMAVDQVARFLGVDLVDSPSTTAPSLTRQADAMSEKWYAELLNALEANPDTSQFGAS